MTKQRLELTWLGKENRPRLEPRILLEDPEKSYRAQRVTDKDIFDNRLIFGDNLLALKALEQEFAGKIKCIYIDPPYNTGSAFEHYDDGIEHSLWLSLMRDRLELLRILLSDDGSIWITIDDNEAHYLKVLCDEVFGRRHFVANGIWQKVYSERMDATAFSASHDHVLIYRKDEAFKVNQMAKEQNVHQFTFFDEKVGKHYRRRSLRKEGSESLRADRPSMWYSITAPDGSDIWPIKPDGTEGRWRWRRENVPENANAIEFIQKEGRWEIYVKQYLEENATRPPGTIWLQDDVGHNHEAKLEVKAFNSERVFDTPKPERLIKRVIELATNPGDIVLDSFAGSGTTGAVAHKMGRRWIMVELGEHCHTHIIPRMKKVIDGVDPGGITKAVGWQGGGGFRYFRLAPSLLEKDKWDNWVIGKEYDATMLASAMAKHEGFLYNPDEALYWKQGRSTEKDFIFTTTNFITIEYLDSIHEEMQPDESLLICCKSFQEACLDRYESITLKKIPNMLLGRCDFGREDYSLNITDMPPESDRSDPDMVPAADVSPQKGKKKPTTRKQDSLFYRADSDRDE